MEVKLIEVKSRKVLHAVIKGKEHFNVELPSFHEGWRFNFYKHSKKKNFKTYGMWCKNTPEVIEGCLIFELRNSSEPYMAYIEVAPQNKGKNKEKKNIAGCLIAFACRLSFTLGKNEYQGWLAFDVLEEKKEDELKLMSIYSIKYKALKFGETTMVISPEGGEKQIKEYLNL